MNACEFDRVFSKNVPHILENIFFSLDYESYKKCLELSYAWNELLKSESYQKKLKEELDRDHEKFWINLTSGTLGGCSEAIIAVRKKSPISAGNAAEVKKFLSGMLDVNRRGGPYHETPLFRAAIRGDKVLAEILLHNGANPNVATRKLLRTSLHVAAARDHRDVIELLLDEGGDPNMVQGVPSELRTGLG